MCAYFCACACERARAFFVRGLVGLMVGDGDGNAARTMPEYLAPSWTPPSWCQIRGKDVSIIRLKIELCFHIR